MSEVGERKNSGKVRWRNFPLFLVEPLMEVGATAEKHPGNPGGKYDTFNFLKGMKVNDCLDSAKRHLMKSESPFSDDFDEESKLHHLAHCAWNCLVALHNIKTRPDLDDRYKTQVTKEEVVVKSKAEKPFQIGDSIKMENSDIVMTVAGFFYDDDNNLVMFVTDDAGRIYQVDYLLYVRV